jgi:hypothetical protein
MASRPSSPLLTSTIVSVVECDALIWLRDLIAVDVALSSLGVPTQSRA